MASPIPVAARKINMSENPEAITVSAVHAEKTAIPSCSTVLRENRASRYAVGIPAIAIPNVKTVESNPTSASEKPKWRRTSGTSIGNNCRSIALMT